LLPHAQYAFTPARPDLPTRGSEPCAFEVLTERPSAPFTELGTLDYAWHYGNGFVSSIDEFKTMVTSLDTRAGGTPPAAK
jgi:hypothetical protein